MRHRKTVHCPPSTTTAMSASFCEIPSDQYIFQKATPSYFLGSNITSSAPIRCPATSMPIWSFMSQWSTMDTKLSVEAFQMKTTTTSDLTTATGRTIATLSKSKPLPSYCLLIAFYLANNWVLSDGCIVINCQMSQIFIMLSIKIILIEIILAWNGCQKNIAQCGGCSYFPHTSYLSIFLHKQNFGLSKFFFQLLHKNIYTTISIKVWKPCLTCGRESGQVNSASVHNQHQYRTDCTGKLCFDRVTETEYVLRNKLCKHPDILNVCRGLIKEQKSNRSSTIKANRLTKRYNQR